MSSRSRAKGAQEFRTTLPVGGVTGLEQPILDRLRAFSCRCRLAGVNQDGPVELDDDGAVRFEAPGADAHEALARPRLRGPCLQHLRLGIDGVTGEHGSRQGDLVPAEIGHDVPADVLDTQSGHQRKGQAAVHEGTTEFGMRGVVGIEVNLVGVAGQQREPGVVGLAQRSTQPVAVHVPNGEVLEEPALGVVAHADPPVPYERGRPRTCSATYAVTSLLVTGATRYSRASRNFRSMPVSTAMPLPP